MLQLSLLDSRSSKFNICRGVLELAARAALASLLKVATRDPTLARREIKNFLDSHGARI